MKYRTRVYAVLVLLILSVLLLAQEQQTSGAEQYFTNTELVDQDGKSWRFYQEILKGRTVVISSFHASCTSTVPIYNGSLEKIQQAFEGRMGSDLLIVSITMDPESDTPAKLKDYAPRFNAGPGWLFLTGSKQNVEFMLKKLGYYVAALEDHSSVFTIGNEKTSLWKKALGLAKSEDLIEIVRSVLDDTGN